MMFVVGSTVTEVTGSGLEASVWNAPTASPCAPTAPTSMTRTSPAMETASRPRREMLLARFFQRLLSPFRRDPNAHVAASA